MRDNNSYKQILKATSIFGGVQVFNILFAVIRSKVVALLLGPAGMGVAGLLNSTSAIIGGITNLGLGTSAVKDISVAYSEADEMRVSKTVSVFRRLVWFTGLLGLCVCLFLSSILSEITFESDKYTYGFAWISLTLLFKQLASGQMVLLQGTRKLKQLANANIFGTVVGFSVSVPIYYYYGIDGIVPAIVLSSFLTMAMAYFWGRKVIVLKTHISFHDIKQEGTNMVKMGFMLSLSGFITTGIAYIIRIVISREGGVSEVGLYSAGFAIISTYVGMVFTAMGTDYFPRLSAVASDKNKTNTIITQQAEVAVLLLGPILTSFIVFSQFIIVLLYSSAFIPITGMVKWAAIGMLFKALSWSIGYVFLAKGDSKVFFINELITNTFFLVANLVGYYVGGLDGLGISFFVSYLFHVIQMVWVGNKNYEFEFKKSVLQPFIVHFSLIIGVFITSVFVETKLSYILGSFIIIISVLYSFKELQRLIDIKNFIQSIKNKYAGK